jgi:hypothetical protein
MSDQYKHLYLKMREVAIDHNLKADKFEKVAHDLYVALADEIGYSSDISEDDPRVKALWAYEQLAFPHP